MRRNQQVELLGNVWLLERCSKKELDAIARVATALDVPAGKVLTKQGDRGIEFFVLVRGKAEATREGTVIGTLGPGSFFGEMSLLDDLPRAATVTTTEPSTVLVIHARDFNTVVTDMPSVDRKMLVMLARRLRDIEDKYIPDGERLVERPPRATRARAGRADRTYLSVTSARAL